MAPVWDRLQVILSHPLKVRVEQPLSSPFPRSLALAVLPALAGLAALLNGSVFWARRVGLLEPDRYWSPYLTLSQSDAARAASYENYLEVLRAGAAMHQVEGILWLTKLAKDLVWMAILVVLAFGIRRMRLPLGMAAAYLGLAGLALNATVAALVRGAWFDIVAGGRAGLAWLLAALGSSLASRELCRIVARTCVVVLVVQAPLMSAELVNGLMMYSTKQFGINFARAAGSFSLPISLGTFTVVTWAVALQWADLPRRLFGLITTLVVLILVVNASATAWVAFLVTAASFFYIRARLHWRVALLLATLPMATRDTPGCCGRWATRRRQCCSGSLDFWGWAWPTASWHWRFGPIPARS